MYPSFPGGATRPRLVLSVVAGALALAGCGSDNPDGTTSTPTTGTESRDAPVTESANEAVDNCGVDVPARRPDKVVTMNQGATEIALSLGFGDRLIGTAYLDDAILPDLAEDHDAIPVISDEYPSTEALFELEPDFVYGSYASAFGEDAAGERAELADLGIGSYLSPAACADFEDSGDAVTFDLIFQEFTDVATIFGDAAAGEALVAEQQALLDEAASADVEGISVFWWDGGLDAPAAGVCCGAPGMIMDAVGVTNAFDDVGGSWAEVSWESVVDADPDVIVLIDASWDPAADKQAHLENDPALSNLTAVQAQRYAIVPFSASTPGVRNAAVVGEISRLIAELDLPG